MRSGVAGQACPAAMRAIRNTRRATPGFTSNSGIGLNSSAVSLSARRMLITPFVHQALFDHRSCMFCLLLEDLIFRSSIELYVIYNFTEFAPRSAAFGYSAARRGARSRRILRVCRMTCCATSFMSVCTNGPTRDRPEPGSDSAAKGTRRETFSESRTRDSHAGTANTRGS